jgi:hypothetical protein
MTLKEKQDEWLKLNPGMELPPDDFFDDDNKAVIQLPKVRDIVPDRQLSIKLDILSTALNNLPNPKHIKAHPFVKIDNPNGDGTKIQLPYLPVDKVENLLTQFFQQWKIEVLAVAQLFNAVAVTVRLHVRNPITGEWMFHDGVGAVGVQTEKGAAASDLAAIRSDAVMKALPAAKSYALKDAAEHLGRVFGRDLTRKDTLSFTPYYADMKGATAAPVKPQ